MSTSDPVMAYLQVLLSDFNGKEYSGAIGPDTLFFADLGMVSIDAVILAETLEGHYGQPFPFGDFLQEVGRQNMRDIRVGTLADFLRAHLVRRDAAE